jgi:hypothetical protein
MDYIMWTIIGIALYLAIGYIFVCSMYVYEEGFWEQIKVMLFWPILLILFSICCIVFIFIEIRNRIKKKNYGREK